MTAAFRRSGVAIKHGKAAHAKPRLAPGLTFIQRH
jgi:hypothetical protein